MKVQKTSKKQFKEFVKECKKYAQRFHLSDWHISFNHVHLKHSDAQNAYNSETRDMTITLSKEISGSFSIKYLAKHEMIHAILADYDYEAQKRSCTLQELIKLNESLVIKLEKLL